MLCAQCRPHSHGRDDSPRTWQVLSPKSSAVAYSLNSSPKHHHLDPIPALFHLYPQLNHFPIIPSGSLDILAYEIYLSRGMAPSTSRFTHPFESNRQASSSSSGSEYLRPDAFSGHRDTLARLSRVGLISGNRAQSVADSSSARSSESSDLSAFPGHRDTLARIPRLHRSSGVQIPAPVINRLLCFLSYKDYLNLRLVCRHWHKSLPQARPRASHRLPPEVLHIIFALLEPSDFDAARHVCRQWFRAAMDLALLRSMLRAAHCQYAYRADVKLQSQAMQQTVSILPAPEDAISN